MTEIAQPYNYFSHNNNIELIKKISLAVLSIGFLFLLVSLTGVSNHQPIIFLLLSLGLIIVGTLTFSIVQIKESPAGVKNNRKFFNSMTNRGVPAWIIGILISGFYSILYWYPSLIENWTRLVDPISYTLSRQTC